MENIRETRLWWFGHVIRKKDEELIKKAWNEPIRGKDAEEDID